MYWPVFFLSMRRLRWGIAAALMALSYAASHAQQDDASLRRWQEKLSAYFASSEQAWRASTSRGYPSYKTIAEIKAASYESEEQRALDILDVSRIAELGADLAAILRVSAPPGFEAEPRLNLETLYPWALRVPAPFGLIYRAAGKEGIVFVTHRKLLDDWLARERPRGVEQVRSLEAALDAGVLYGAVFSPDAPERVAARLPIRVPPESAGAAALLVTWTSDLADRQPPTHLVVALIRNNRVAMGSLPLDVRLPASQNCAAEAKQKAGKRRDIDARRAFRACYAKSVAGRPELAQATQQAQALLAQAFQTLEQQRKDAAVAAP